jgi:ASC-1-like (ASCH) protein
MDHVAIMRKSWGLIPKLLDGRKKIESRWGINKCAPWGKVNVGDTVYFKNSGEPVIVKAKVSGVKQFENLDNQKVRKILEKYGGDDGISVANLEETIKWAKEKRFCTLIFLKDACKIKPFNINKKGFGVGAAWITVEDVKKIII